MGRVGIIALCLVLCGGCLTDRDGDGIREVLFAGDSNTHFLPCAYPLAWEARQDPAVLTGYDEGIFGTTAYGWVHHGFLEVALARDNPDAVVIALGTNDVGWRVPPVIIMANLAMLYRQAVDYVLPNGAHPLVAIATVPPLYDPLGTDPERTAAMNADIRTLNDLIRDWLPQSRVIDFDSWMPAQWDPIFMWTNAKGEPDGVHIGCAAHEIRADLTDDLLLRIS